MLLFQTFYFSTINILLINFTINIIFVIIKYFQKIVIIKKVLNLFVNYNKCDNKLHQ